MDDLTKEFSEKGIKKGDLVQIILKEGVVIEKISIANINDDSVAEANLPNKGGRYHAGYVVEFEKDRVILCDELPIGGTGCGISREHIYSIEKR